MSKKTTPKVSRRNAPVVVDVDYLGAAGHNGDTSIGVSLVRHVLVDTEIGQLEINAWEARRLARMLNTAADAMEQM